MIAAPTERKVRKREISTMENSISYLCANSENKLNDMQLIRDFREEISKI